MDTLEGIVATILAKIVTPLVMLLFMAATIVFFWGLIEYLWKSDNAEERTKGRQHMLWGIIGLFIMFSAATILSIICEFFSNSCSVYVLNPF